jgi:hypothetical protein
MWKLLKFIGVTIKTLFWLALVIALIGVIALYILEHDIPAPLIRRAEELLSDDQYYCRIERATYSLKSGLHLHHVKTFQKRIADTAMVSVDEISVAIDCRPYVALSKRLRGITLRAISFPKLPQKATNTVAKVESPSHSSQAVQPELRTPQPQFPTIEAFPLIIERANILGLQAERITATVSLQDLRVSVSEVEVRWPDRSFDMKVDGYVTADLATRMISGKAKGQTFPDNILPLLNALRARGAIKQINNFSKLDRPVKADATFDINMDNSDFSLILDLDVGPCAYRDVPMKYAKGILRAYGTNIYTTVDIGPLQAESDTGPIAGSLVYREENESLALDVSTAMELDQVVKVINILNHGELKPIRCKTPPHVTAQGIMAIDSRKSTVTNELSGKITFDEGSVFNLEVRNVSADLKINGYSALFDNVTGTSASGGPISGNVLFTFPYYSATATLFTAHANLSEVDLTDLSRAFNVTNARVGIVSGNFLIHGRASNHTIPSLSGNGKIDIRDGLLHRLPLFAGFTSYLAANIPGVSSLVNQSAGSMDFRIKDGILSTDNLLIEGDLFSMHGRGTCNLDTEAVEFLIRANIFKEKTFAGKLSRLVTLPFTRLLLEFKVLGTLDKSDLSYVNIVEKISGGLTEITGPRKRENTSEEPDFPEPLPTP